MSVGSRETIGELETQKHVKPQQEVKCRDLVNRAKSVAAYCGVLILGGGAGIAGFKIYERFIKPDEAYDRQELIAKARKLGYPTEVNYRLEPAYWRAQGLTTDAAISLAILKSIADSENACFNTGCALADANVISDNYTNAGSEFTKHLQNDHTDKFHIAMPAVSSTGNITNFYSSNVSCPGDVNGVMYTGEFYAHSIERSYEKLPENSEGQDGKKTIPYTNSSMAFPISYVIVASGGTQKIWAGGSGYMHAQDAAKECVTIQGKER